MEKEIQIEILDRVKYIAEHFETLTLIEIATLFVAAATLFTDTKNQFYYSYLKVMQQTLAAKQTNRQMGDEVKQLEYHMRLDV